MTTVSLWVTTPTTHARLGSHRDRLDRGSTHGVLGGFSNREWQRGLRSGLGARRRLKKVMRTSARPRPPRREEAPRRQNGVLVDRVELRARASEGSDASAGLPQSLLRFVREDEPHLVKAEVVGAPAAHRRDCDVVLGEQTLGELVGG
jgi:hypothetical protein